MQFPSPLVRGVLRRRYKRFLADVTLDDGSEVTASCPNTGSMLGLKEPGMVVWLSTSDSRTRKYRHTWELVECGSTLVGINTSHPNRLVEEAIRAQQVAICDGYAELKREQKYGQNSRIDLLLADPAKGLAYVEVKNVHFSRQSDLAEFPDSVTERGAKHLREMSTMVAAGHRAIMVFLVQRADVSSLSLARDLDAGYAAAFDLASAAGVEAIALRCRMSTEGIIVDREIPIR